MGHTFFSESTLTAIKCKLLFWSPRENWLFKLLKFASKWASTAASRFWQQLVVLICATISFGWTRPSTSLLLHLAESSISLQKILPKSTRATWLVSKFCWSLLLNNIFSWCLTKLTSSCRTSSSAWSTQLFANFPFHVKFCSTLQLSLNLSWFVIHSDLHFYAGFRSS